MFFFIRKGKSRAELKKIILNNTIYVKTIKNRKVGREIDKSQKS
jgi:predicted rRNA methylase YqxC with S4 and FtsJ domains